MKAVGYIRVSTDMQADKGTSLENQIARIKEYAESKGFVLENIFQDAGYSGKNTRRPGFQSMFTRLREGGIKAVIVWHTTRFARNLKDNIVHMAELEQRRIHFYSVEEPMMSGSSGKAMRNLMAVFAEYQSDVTGDHTRSVHDRALRRDARGGRSGDAHSAGRCDAGDDPPDARAHRNRSALSRTIRPVQIGRAHV